MIFAARLGACLNLPALPENKSLCQNASPSFRRRFRNRQSVYRYDICKGQ